MQKITPFLWFNDNAEAAMDFYISIFKNAKIVNVMRHEGKVISGTFQLEGQEFMVLNGGPHFKFTEAISLFVSCKTQEEVDELWGKLLAEGGQEGQCGWLKDKYGLSWQVVPTILGELLRDKDAAKANRVMEAMLKMNKIDIEKLKAAYES